MLNYSFKPSEAISALSTIIKTRRPAFMSGPPGIGKSQIVAQVAQSFGLELRDIRATLLDPVDLRGLPQVADGLTRWLPPSFLPRAGAPGLLFLDELNAAPHSVQVACLQLILDRRIGDYELPDNWVVLAAGNRLVDAAGSQRMLTSLGNRFVHMEIRSDLDDWIKWALAEGIQPELIGFLKWRPEHLHKHSKDEYAFPTPRSWSFASQLLQAQPSKDVEEALIAGCVGAGTAHEFYAYLELYRQLPDLEVWLKKPDDADIPNDPGQRYAVTYALALHAKPENFGAVVKLFSMLPPQFGVLGLKAATQRDQRLLGVCDPKGKNYFAEYAGKHQEAFTG